MPETATARKRTTKATAPAPTPDPVETDATITARQMRELHGALRDHGITGDKAVHDYITIALGRSIESRTELTRIEAAFLIAELEESPVTQAPTPQKLTELREPFPEEAIGKLPRSTCRDCSKAQNKRCDNPEHRWVPNCPVCHGRHSSATMHIDYVGHADVTARLLAVDPGWTWRPFTAEEVAGINPNLRDGLWIMLTICGVTRPGFGDTENGKGAKEAIGDALRNAAMRFGVALDLWAKGDRDWARTAVQETGATEQPMDPPAPRERQVDAPAPYHGPSTAELLAMIDEHAQRAGMTYADITAKYREEHGGLTVAQLDEQDPREVAKLEASIAEYLRKNPPQPSDRDV